MTSITTLLYRTRRFIISLLGFAVLVLTCGAAPAHALAQDVWAAFDAPWFDRVDASGGLPHSITTAVAQDRSGLIWIGTMGGLVRYDGYRMQVFKSGAGSAAGLPDAYIRSLLPLPDGGMLVGTNAGGLTRFDPASNSFHAYAGNADSLVDGKVYGLSTDHDNGVWIATDRGLAYLNLHSDTLEHVATGAGISPLSFSVLQDRADNLWLGNNNGLFVRYAGSRDFVRPARPSGVVATVLANQIWALREDREGRLWVGSGQTGAVYKNPDGQWLAVPGFSGHRDDVDQSTVRDFLEAAPGAMWIGTDGNGVIEYRAGSDHTRSIVHDPATLSSLPGNTVRGMLKDTMGNVWIATDLGVARYNPNARTAFALLSSPLVPNALADTNVHGVFVDSRQRIWLGLANGRIDMIDLKRGSLRHLRLVGAQSYRQVQAFSETPDGAIWVGAYGISRIDPDTLQLRPSIVPALVDIPVLSLLAEGPSLLIGTYDGIYRFDPHTLALQHIVHQPGVPGSLVNNAVRTINRVGNSIWYGTSQGISIADAEGQSDHFTTIQHHDCDKNCLPQNYIGSITADPRGAIWVSTFGGLAMLKQHVTGQPYRFDTIGLKQGLSSDRVNAVLADADSNLWASTSNGIAMIDGKSHAVVNLSTRDGLQIPSSIYSDSAAARTVDGSLLFGGVGGLTVVRPSWRHPALPNAPLALTSVTTNGRVFPFSRLPVSGETITLDGPGTRDRSLKAEFSLLDYEHPSATVYSYRLHGFEDNWTEIARGALPTAAYTNLPHGRYTLELRARTTGMHSQSIQNHFNVEVTARWYETLLARLAAALLVIALIFALVHLRTLYLRRQALELQRQIEEHTVELRAANQRLNTLASTDELTGVYNRRRFLELARAARAAASALEAPLACMAVFDIDRFKNVNDSYGHLAGDAVIRHVINVIRGQCRPTDVIGRYGGEEFVLCLPDTHLAHGQKISERIRQLLSQTPASYEGRSITVTTSVGIAQLQGDESIEQWLSRADRALYQAKRSGRNQCFAAS